MELVYLWVEKYKNIENQGFSFSPRFTCRFENNELKIEDKKETKKPYLENFFGKKINVTAIVGENGSGKSSILKALFQNDNLSSVDDELWYILYSGDKLNIYFIDYKGIHEKIDIEKNFTHNIDTLKTSSSIATKLNFSMIYFSNILQYLPAHNDKQNKNFYNISTSYLINRYNNKLSNDKFIEFKYQYNYYKSKIIVQTISMLRDFELKLDFELPQSLNIVIQGDYPPNNLEQMEKLVKTDCSDFKSRAKQKIIYNYLFHYLDEERLQELLEESNDAKTIEAFYEEKIPYGQNELNDLLSKLETQNFMTSIKIKDIDDDFIDKLQKFNKIQALSLGVLDVFNFNWTPELSSGQENYLFQFASFYDTLKHANNLENDIVILVDEGETTMHPNWQKRYIKYYIDFLEKNFKDKNFHLILTSHSPFILSDLPKENVIFLKDGEQDKTVDIDTFGANIHTLLSNGFFMKDGLMGEFAKEKINQAYNFITQKDTNFIKTKEEAQNIINIIGEPLIKKQLQKLFDETFDKSNLTLDDEIELLEKKLNALKELKK